MKMSEFQNIIKKRHKDILIFLSNYPNVCKIYIIMFEPFILLLIFYYLLRTNLKTNKNVINIRLNAKLVITNTHENNLSRKLD